MLKITALLTALALGATVSIANASPARSYARRAGVEYTRGGVDVERSLRPGVERVRIDRRPVRIDAFDGGARRDGFDRRHLGRNVDDFGPRRYRPTWVALGALHRPGAGEACIEVRDTGTFTQLRLQSDAGFTAVDRVIVQFADGTDQIAYLGRELDRRGEFVELPLDGNNRRIAKIIVTGAFGDLQVFAI